MELEVPNTHDTCPINDVTDRVKFFYIIKCGKQAHYELKTCMGPTQIPIH